MELKNFFDLKPSELEVLNPYDFDAAINRLENLTLDDVKDDTKYFQKKDFDFRTYEEEVSFSLNNVKIITSSKNDSGEDEYYILKDLQNFLISDEKLQQLNESKGKDNSKVYKKIKLEIKTSEGGQKQILIILLVDPKIISQNVLNNFLEKSKFESIKKVEDKFNENLKNQVIFRFTMKLETKYLNKIIYSPKKGQYFLDLQSPPFFRTNFITSVHEKKEEDKDKNKEKDKIHKEKDENCLFLFRNFNDEMTNLEYRHFIIMIEKDLGMDTPSDDADYNETFDTNKELNNALENLYKNRNGEVDKNKYIEKEIMMKYKDKKLKDLSYYFNYDINKEVKKNLKNLLFLEEDEDNIIEDQEEEIKKNDYLTDNQIIKLFYQVLALISECILSYNNGLRLLENLLILNKYKNSTFRKCRDEDFPIFFNLTLTKILDRYQNSLEEKSLKEFENEMQSTFDSLYSLYEIEGLEEICKPSKNPILMRIQRCVITPTYILFTPYVLEQGNRVLREFIKASTDTILCTFKMDTMGEDRWSNSILVEYIKFILSNGFKIGEKNFRFFNYSQSQFRSLSCWLLTNPEEIIKKLGDFSNIKPVSKYAARISQTLTTTMKTIIIPKDKIRFIDDIKANGYIFSDGVGRISYKLAKQINDEFLKLNYIPSCFQGRFLGCKGVWTTMWDDNSGQIYCRGSQTKFIVEPDEKINYFELCDYSRYIQSYLNRQVILLLKALGIRDEKFEKKLNDYQKKLYDPKFVLSLVHYPEWRKIFNRMYSCGINRVNDRLLKTLIESNLDILYDDVKKKARIYVDESAYVKGIMDEYGILNYGEAFLHIKRDDLDLILDKKAAIAKCPCLYPGDIQVLRFRKYNKNIISTKKYEIFNKYENVIIFPSRGKRPHPNECSGSDLDGDDYFVFYDSDLIPVKKVEPMSYDFPSGPINENEKYTINDVISYFAEYTNYNNLGLIGDAHMAISDKQEKGANDPTSRKIAVKFAEAVDAPKTGKKIELNDDENPKLFPHFMEKNKINVYHSTSILGKLYDKANDMIYQRTRRRYLNNTFYDKDLKLNGWENYAFMALRFYRDYFNEFNKMLTKNEISGETILLTGNNIDNENNIFQKKKNNYDIREKLGYEIHYLFVKNKNNFYNAIYDFFINENSKKIKNIINKNDLINISLVFNTNLNLFASACYMISYNLLEDVLNKKIDKNSVIESFGNDFSNLIKSNLIINDELYNLNDITEYESLNMGTDYYENYQSNQDYIYDTNSTQIKLIDEIIDKKKKDMDNFIKELKNMPIPSQANEENKYRILSFPWCISGVILANIKYLTY